MSDATPTELGSLGQMAQKLESAQNGQKSDPRPQWLQNQNPPDRGLMATIRRKIAQLQGKDDLSEEIIQTSAVETAYGATKTPSVETPEKP